MFLLLGFLNLKAQDVHFTMYDIMPMTINPAATGLFDGDIRGVLNYRSQWGSIGNPFKTYAVGVDGGLFKSKWRNGYLGVGLNAFKDVAGTTNFGTTNINLSLSSIIFLNNRNAASIGVKGSWVQNSIDSENLQWSSQFDGQSYNSSLSSNESFAFENKSYVDFSVGGLWYYGKGAKTLSSQDEFKVLSGVNFEHITQPSQQIEFGEVDKLYSKLLFHSEAFIGLNNSKLAVKPKFLLMFQGPAREILLGAMIRYRIQEESKYTGILDGMAIAFGGYFRVGDAFAPSVEFEMANFAIGVAYDMNISGLTAATNGNGGMEIYLKFQNPNPFTKKSSTARFN